MKKDQMREERVAEAGRGREMARNAEPPPAERPELERAEQMGRRRAAEEDLFLHDDDEAELDLPR